MIRSYFKTALRNLLKRSDYSILNILGLSIGITCCLLIFQYVSYEKSYDNFPKADQIVRLRLDNYQDGKLDWQSAAVYPAFATFMKKDFPEIKDYCCRLHSPNRFSIGDEDQKCHHYLNSLG